MIRSQPSKELILKQHVCFIGLIIKFQSLEHHRKHLVLLRLSAIRCPSFLHVWHACNFRYPALRCLPCYHAALPPMALLFRHWTQPVSCHHGLRDMAKLTQTSRHGRKGPGRHWDLETTTYPSASTAAACCLNNYFGVIYTLQQTNSPCKHIPLRRKNQTSLAA